MSGFPSGCTELVNRERMPCLLYSQILKVFTVLDLFFADLELPMLFIVVRRKLTLFRVRASSCASTKTASSVQADLGLDNTADYMGCESYLDALETGKSLSEASGRIAWVRSHAGKEDGKGDEERIERWKEM